MDFPYSFQTAPQPYQFLGLPPTPSHTNSAHSDDFSNGSPPDQYEQFQQFEFGFNTHTHNQNHNHNHNVIQQPVKPPTPQSHHKPSISGMNANLHQNQAYDHNSQDANDDSRQQRGGSNSDDDENMTPAQSRRKAQNRAAQRAFRERKERHVKDLEAKLAALTSSSTNLSTENELLRQQLQRASTENEILRATSGHQHNSASPPPSTGPMRYSPKDFYTDVLEPHDNKTISHRVSKGESGERLLAAGATWDYIINSEQYKRGLVDVGDISERLKMRARCDGQGPVFEERVIREAIEQSVASGNDELL